MLIKKVLIDRADRLYQMPPDILDFARPLLGKPILPGQPILDLASFEWPNLDESPEKLTSEALAPASATKLTALKTTLADWLSQYLGRERVSPKEIFLGGGIRSLLFHLSVAFVEPGDPVLVPALAIPTYRKLITAMGGLPVSYPLSPRNNWSPDFSKISARVGQAVRVCIINSPHNPTGAELDEATLEQLIVRCGKENMLLVNDACYHAIPSRKPLCLSASEYGTKVGLELFSFSYLLGLPPIPFGFAVGHRNLISALESASAIGPVGIPSGYLEMVTTALRQSNSRSMASYRQRFTATSAVAQELLGKLGMTAATPATTPFLWAKIPQRRNSVAFARMLLKRYRILTAPGTGFGESGQGYVRLSLTAPKDRYQSAIDRIKARHLLPRRRSSS